MIRQKIGRFIGNNKTNFIDFYDEIDFIDTEDFLEIIENYSIYKEFTNEDLKILLDKDYVHVYLVLKFKKLTECFDCVVKEKKEVEQIFSSGVGLESSVSISYPIDQEEAIQLNMDNTSIDIKVSRKWLK